MATSPCEPKQKHQHQQHGTFHRPKRKIEAQKGYPGKGKNQIKPGEREKK